MDIQSLLEPAPPPAETDSEASPQLVSAWRAGLAISLCLLLWAILMAPVLERSAEAGPVGARRSAALAILRPLVTLSERLGSARATVAVERALGRDPDAQPGGELILPEFEAPAGGFDASPLPLADSTTHPTRGPVVDDREDRASPAGGGGDGSGGGRNDGKNGGGGGKEEPSDPVSLREPKRSDELRVAVIGDSLSQGLGPAIARWMEPSLVEVLPLGRQSTGLSRQDYFNWQAGMRKIVDEFRPDLVFVMLGSNDAQPQISTDGSAIPTGSVEWVKAYRERAARLISEATDSGARVVWVGIPIVEPRNRWDFYRRVNDIYRDTAGADPLGTYVDTWSAFRAKDGGYRAYVRNDRGVLQEMRAPDGIHFTPTGYAHLAKLALREAAQAFRLSQDAVTFRL